MSIVFGKKSDVFEKKSDVFEKTSDIFCVPPKNPVFSRNLVDFGLLILEINTLCFWQLLDNSYFCNYHFSCIQPLAIAGMEELHDL